ncbi:hypothetical protein RND81_13G070800 [Saponaria officinalis]|uniref:RRM domain-containing protein n=1 Tax=Saponaria officinalis TaxID=3572 RepID=A0AAW1GXS9_SAPOF
MAATSTFSAIVTPSSFSSSSTPLTHLPTYHFHSFTHLSPKPTNLIIKPVSLKPYNFTPPLRFRQCTSSTVFGDTDIAEQNPDDVQQELEESEIDENDEVEVEESDDQSSDSSNDGRLYVGNLPYSMTSSQLPEIFSQAGLIKSVEIIYDKMTDRSRGFGFVTMETIDEAREAIRMFDGSQVGGRTVRVNFPEVPKGGERKMMGARARINNQSFVETPHKIYAGNLGWGVTTQGLRDAFADQEGFLSAKVVYERESGRSRGFGFISFSSVEAAESALSAMNGTELEGRPLRMNFASERSRPDSGADA